MLLVAGAAAATLIVTHFYRVKLLFAGADPNARDGMGRSAFASICAGGCTDAAAFSIGFGAGAAAA